MTGIAFFDLDKTLISVNSATLWVKREIRTGHLPKQAAFRAAGWTFLYELGFARIESALETAVKTLDGQKETDLAERVAAFFEEEARRLIRPGAPRAVERHAKAGDVVSLLTSSSCYLGKHFAETLGAQHVLSNRFVVDDEGRFTGEPVRPWCYGPGKVHYAKALAEELGIDLKDCTFYTDSYADLPVLEAVGHPVCVHPDPRLRRAAVGRGWPIEVWS